MRRADSGRRTDRDGQFATCSPSGATLEEAQHVRIKLEDVAANGVASGFDDYEFLHCALPELNLDQVDPSTELFGRRLSAPVLISSLVGGTQQAVSIDHVLARVAQRLGLAIGLGLRRNLLEDPDLLKSIAIRHVAPDVLLFASLDAVQLNKGYGVEHCRRLVDALGADALVLHLNALQEAVQPEGDTCFAGMLAKIADLSHRLDVPVVVKEMGWGIAPDAVRALLDAGVAAVDVAGAGGRSWREVERPRIAEPWRARVAAAFARCGISTAECLRRARQVAPEAAIIASGGILDGIDIAKALALGADLVGIDGPFLRTAAMGKEAALDLGRELVETLRVAMFSLGARTLADLRSTTRLRHRFEKPDEPHVAELTYRTGGAGQFLDITNDVSAVVHSSGIRRGLAHVYAMHTTAAIRINENERLLLQDFRRFLNRLAPPGDGAYEHDDLPRRPDVPPDEPMNGHAHCQHLLLSASELVPILDGQLQLGRWQRIFLMELCTARERRVMVQVLGR